MNIIIGAGVYGLSVALKLLEEGEDVVVIDGSHPNIASINALGRLDPIFRGAGSYNSSSHHEKALLKPQNQKHLALDSYLRHKDNYEKIVKESGIDYKLKEIKTLQVCFSKEEFLEIENSKQEAESSGFNVELINNKELGSYQRGVSKEIIGAALVSGTLFLNSKLFISALRKNVEINGGIFINKLVDKLYIEDKEVQTIDGSKIKYENLIICAGPWTNKIISSTGVKIDFYPAKGEIIKVSSEGINLIGHLHGPCSIVKKDDGLIWIAATYEDNVFNSNNSVKAEQQLLTNASKILPGIVNQKIIDHTACVRPSTKDDMPRTGEIIKGSKIFVATGGGGWGIMNSFYIGEVVKKLVLDNISSLSNI